MVLLFIGLKYETVFSHIKELIAICEKTEKYRRALRYRMRNGHHISAISEFCLADVAEEGGGPLFIMVLIDMSRKESGHQTKETGKDEDCFTFVLHSFYIENKSCHFILCTLFFDVRDWNYFFAHGKKSLLTNRGHKIIH